MTLRGAFRCSVSWFESAAPHASRTRSLERLWKTRGPSCPQAACRGWRSVGGVLLHGAMTETTSGLRAAADIVLSRLVGAEPGAARLREDQWRAVEALVAHARR